MAELFGKPVVATLPRKLLRVNWLLAFLTAAIAVIGSVMLHSVAGGRLEPWAATHMWRFGAGFCLMLVIALVDIRVWLKLALPAYAIALVLLALVPFVGVSALGAKRWLELGG